MIIGSTIRDVQFAVSAAATMPDRWDGTLGREFRPEIPDRDEGEELYVHWDLEYMFPSRPARMRPAFAMVADLTTVSGAWRLVVPEIRISDWEQRYTMKWMLSPELLAAVESGRAGRSRG